MFELFVASEAARDKIRRLGGAGLPPAARSTDGQARTPEGGGDPIHVRCGAATGWPSGSSHRRRRSGPPTRRAVVRSEARDPRERRHPDDGAFAAAGRAASRSRATRSPAASARTRPRYRDPSESTSAADACCPASRTRTCTSPPGRWPSTRSGSRTRALGRGARARARARSSAPGSTWLRGRGWRSGDWSPPVEPTKDSAGRDRPGPAGRADGPRLALRSGSTRPALAPRRTAICRCPAASSSSTSAASRPACCARSPAGTSATATSRRADDEYVEAMRAGCEAGGHPRRDRGPRQGRLARRAAFLAAPRGRGFRSGCASGSRCRPRRQTSSPTWTCAAASAARC